MILCSNPLAQYQAHKTAIDEAISKVLNKGWYVLGEEVKAFEEDFASYIGVSHGIGVGSGTEAIHLSLAACGIGSNDEVITVSHTAVATVAAIKLVGAKPVLVDIEPDFYTMDPEKLDAAISPHTKAIIPVHIYGQPVDMDPVLEIAKNNNIYVIEDCAQAHGAKYRGKRVGSWGDIGCFSFYPTKNLGALGDGGMVVTNNPDLAEKSRLLREYGWSQRRISVLPGWNTRLDELQAAILRVKLRYLDDDNERRAKLAKVYDQALSGINLSLPVKRAGSTHVYHLYVVRSKRRNEMQKFLKDKKIGTLIHYPVPVHLQSAYDYLSKNNILTETELMAKEILSLPMYSELSEPDVRVVCAAIKEFHKKVS